MLISDGLQTLPEPKKEGQIVHTDHELLFMGVPAIIKKFCNCETLSFHHSAANGHSGQGVAKKTEKLQLATSRQFNIQKLQQGDTSRCKIETNVRLVLYFSFLSHSFPVCQPVAQEENVYSTQTTILYSILKTENVYSIPTILYNISRTENVYSIPTRFFYTASLFTPGSFRMSY